MSLDTILGDAYKTSVLKGQPVNARVTLKAALDGDEALKTEAQAFLAANCSNAITQRCFITKTRVDLLKAALAN